MWSPGFASGITTNPDLLQSIGWGVSDNEIYIGDPGRVELCWCTSVVLRVRLLFRTKQMEVIKANPRPSRSLPSASEVDTDPNRWSPPGDFRGEGSVTEPCFGSACWNLPGRLQVPSGKICGVFKGKEGIVHSSLIQAGETERGRGGAVLNR